MIWLMALGGLPTDVDQAASHALACVRAELGLAPPPAPIPGPAQGVFITIESRGKVIACRGTLAPAKSSLHEEIKFIAGHAVRHDPRYGPVNLKGRPFSVTLTLVDALVPFTGLGSLLPEHGLVLSWQDRKGIVLPWEGRDPATRLEWARKKAAAPPGASCHLQLLLARRSRAS